MKIIRWILETIIGFFVVTLGFIEFFTFPWAGIGIMITGFIILPFFWKHLTRLSFVKDSQFIRFTAIGLFAVLSLNMMDMNRQSIHNAEKAERQKAAYELAEKEKQERLAYYKENKDEILDKAALAMESENYHQVVNLTYKYRQTNDPKLLELYRAAKTETLLEEARSRSDDVGALVGIYDELIKLNPDNDNYAQKHIKLKGDLLKLNAKRASEAAAAERRQKNIDQQFSAWDGSHKALTAFIKDNMNDPSSYEHVETRYSDKGDHLMVFTVFRGNNAFGALVRNAIKAKISMDGEILQIIE